MVDWSISDVMQRYHKVRPPFIWQNGNTHLSFAQVEEAMSHVCCLKKTCTDSEWPSLIKGQAIDQRLMAELERLLAIVKTEEMSENEVGEELLARASSLLAQLRKLER